jgi:hypothetical protein
VIVNDGGGPHVDPVTPAELVAQVAALGTGGTGASAVLVYYVKGTARQTILPNGNAGLPSPGTNSPTGFWCTFWDDELNPGAGKHWRPTAALNGGNGAPCLATGELAGQGLELPSAVHDAFLAQCHADPNGPVNSVITGSGGLNRILEDASSGITYFGLNKFRNNTGILRVGEEAADANYVHLETDEVGGQFEAMTDAPGLSDVNSFGIGTPPIPWAKWVTNTPQVPFSVNRFSRALMHDDTANIYVNGTGNPLATGRRIRWLVNGGNVANSDVAGSEFGIMVGRANPAQQKLICDWFAARYPTTWEDPRTRIGYMYGDSFRSPYQNTATGRVIVSGAHNLAAIPDFALSVFARSGDNVERYQFPFLQLLKANDFSRYTRVSVAFSEWINDSAGRDAATQLIRNYYAVDFARGISSKVRVVMPNDTYNTATNKTVNDPAVNSDLQTNAVSLHGVVAVIDFLGSLFYDPYFFGNGSAASQTVLWNNADNHPGPQGQEYWDAFWQVAFMLANGDDVSTKTMKVDPSASNVALSAGTPTATPTWTPKRYDGAALGGKTISYAMYKIIGGVPTPDTSVATVNASTGQITRVAAGTAYVRALSNDGGIGVCGVVCS